MLRHKHKLMLLPPVPRLRRARMLRLKPLLLPVPRLRINRPRHLLLRFKLLLLIQLTRSPLQTPMLRPSMYRLYPIPMQVRILMLERTLLPLLRQEPFLICRSSPFTPLPKTKTVILNPKTSLLKTELPRIESLQGVTAAAEC